MLLFQRRAGAVFGAVVLVAHQCGGDLVGTFDGGQAVFEGIAVDSARWLDRGSASTRRRSDRATAETDMFSKRWMIDVIKMTLDFATLVHDRAPVEAGAGAHP